MSYLKRVLGLIDPPRSAEPQDDDEMATAVERNKNAASNLQSAAFRQMTNAELVRITVQTIVSRIEDKGQKDEATYQN